MPALQYLNKDLHTAAGRRSLHEPRKPDLQRVTREARIQARKRIFRPASTTATETAAWLEEGFDLSMKAIRSCMRQTAQFAREHPLQLAVGAIISGVVVGLLIRRR